MQQLYIRHKNGRKIYAQLYVPDTDKEKYPVVIISHAFGGTLKRTAPYAEILSKNGFMCCIFDFCGGALKSQSDGSLLDMSVLTEADDISTVLDFILKTPKADKNNIFIMGESIGGTASAIAAVKREKDISALILLYPALSIPDDARKLYNDISHIPNNPKALGLDVGKIYYEDVIDMNIYDEIKHFNKDVLIFHGTDDRLVPIEYSQKAAAVYKSAEFIAVSGAKHGFKDEALELAAEKIVEFLNNEIK